MLDLIIFGVKFINAMINELGFTEAREIKKWRCEEDLSLEEISKRFYNRYGDDNGFIPRRTKEEKYTNFFSRIWGYDILVAAQLALNESRNSKGWNLPKL